MNKNIRLAENIGENLRIFSKNILNGSLQNVVKLFGGTISYKKNDDEIIGLIILGNNKFKITLDKINSPSYDNFYVIKALGDYILFNGETDKKNYPSYRDDETNIISNSFAYGFLTHKQEFIKKSKEFKDSDLLLAAYFEIPVEFIKIRKQSLKSIIEKEVKTR